MKRLIIFSLAFFVTIDFCHGQLPSELFTNIWKVDQCMYVFGSNTNNLYHKDSANNLINYSTIQYHFFSNNTYTVISDTSSYQGTWEINASGDSAVIDSIPYLLVALSSSHFTTRASTLQVTDTAGTIDTAYIFLSLYPALLISLPVDLISFTGHYANNQVILKWSANNNLQNKEFRVQHSTDGINFKTIGTVADKSIGSLAVDYEYNTMQCKAGINLYRLMKVDLDGHSTFSISVYISINSFNQSYVSLSPNPTSNKINLSFSQPVNGTLELVLTTITGQKVWYTTLAGNSNNTEILLPYLAKGFYMAYIIDDKGETILHNKLVIQ